MNGSSTKCAEVKDSITLTIGNITYTIEHVYNGNRTVQEVIGDFLEREVRKLDA